MVFESTSQNPRAGESGGRRAFGAGNSRVDIIKLDVGGAELSALKGTARLLRGITRPAILVRPLIGMSEVSICGCDSSGTRAYTPSMRLSEDIASIPMPSVPQTWSAIIKDATKLLRAS